MSPSPVCAAAVEMRVTWPMDVRHPAAKKLAIVLRTAQNLNCAVSALWRSILLADALLLFTVLTSSKCLGRATNLKLERATNLQGMRVKYIIGTRQEVNCAIGKIVSVTENVSVTRNKIVIERVHGSMNVTTHIMGWIVTVIVTMIVTFQTIALLMRTLTGHLSEGIASAVIVVGVKHPFLF